MDLFFHYCVNGFSNCYILGTGTPDETATPTGESTPAGAPEAIIIDPGSIDNEIIDYIEKGDYKLRGALFTHDHASHSGGLKTLKKIYGVEIFSMSSSIAEFKSTRVRDGDIIEIGPFKVEIISIPGHSSDSVIYKIDHLLFTGDTLSAGLVGGATSSSGSQVQMTSLRSKIFPLPGDYIVLPGHGPPSTLEAERLFNVKVKQYEQNKNVHEKKIHWDDIG